MSLSSLLPSCRCVSRATVLLSTLALGLQAGAQELPARKPGFWEIQIKADQDPAMTMHQCLDAQTDARLQQAGSGVMESNCSKNVMQRDGSGWRGESVCRLGKTTLTSRSTITGDFGSEFRMVVDARYDPPMMGKAQSSTTVTHRFKGACPAGWKPGDMELPGTNQRMNINQMPGAKKP
jgi:hypothetical protein